MDIDDFKIVAAVAKHGSMNRAAAELHMVQSSITARVRLIEEELGVALFVRHSRGVRLSDAGKRLLSYSDRINDLFDEAISSARQDEMPKGSLRVGTTEPTASLRLPLVIADYVKAYPDVKMTITTANSSELIEQVLDRQLDGAFVAGPVRLADLTEETIFVEDLVLVGPEFAQDIAGLRSIQNLKGLVLAEGCSYREKLSDILDELRITRDVLPLASFDAIRTCVVLGVGVTLVPREFVLSTWRESAIVLHELPASMGRVETVFIRRTDSPNLSSLNAFLTMTRTAANLAHGLRAI